MMNTFVVNMLFNALICISWWIIMIGRLNFCFCFKSCIDPRFETHLTMIFEF